MKKLYSKKLGGEAFALDAARLDTLKRPVIPYRARRKLSRTRRRSKSSRRRESGRMSSLILRPALSKSARGRRRSPRARSAASLVR